MLAADTERAALMIESETCEDPDRLGDVYERLIAIDAYTAPARASQILLGLGFDEEAQNRPLDSFSGGWKMRVALAALLVFPMYFLRSFAYAGLVVVAFTALATLIVTPAALMVFTRERRPQGERRGWLARLFRRKAKAREEGSQELLFRAANIANHFFSLDFLCLIQDIEDAV